MKKLPVAEIIAVGSELLTPARTDTNSLFITDQLNSLGIEVIRKTIVGDSDPDIRTALDLALATSNIVILTGGLGPTQDDRTREVVAQHLGRPLELQQPILDTLTDRYKNFHLKMTENNKRQAMVPKGAVVLENPNGTAPGLFLEEAGKLVFLLPGPPRELKPMVNGHVRSIVQAHLPTSTRYSRHLRVASQAESRVDSLVAPIYANYTSVETTILSSPGIIELHFNWRGIDDREKAEVELDQLVGGVRRKLGMAVFSEDGEDLSTVLGQQLRERGWTLGTAESCTGGMLGGIVTSVAGSSDYYQGGYVTYSNELKTGLLGVSEEILREFGAVSSQTAEAMAAGVQEKLGVDTAIAITGIAGPDGGTLDKPVGTVFFGLVVRNRTISKRRVLPGNRQTIRLRASRFALDWLRRELIEHG